jgi:hypothetical protein
METEIVSEHESRATLLEQNQSKRALDEITKGGFS